MAFLVLAALALGESLRTSLAPGAPGMIASAWADDDDDDDDGGGRGGASSGDRGYGPPPVPERQGDIREDARELYRRLQGLIGRPPTPTAPRSAPAPRAAMRAPPLPAPVAPRPIEFAGGEVLASEILARQLDEDGRERLIAEGFRVLGVEPVGAFDLTVTRLGTPPAVQAPDALALAQAALPEVGFSLHHLYRLAAEPVPCDEARCWDRVLVGLDAPDPTCGAGVAVGMVDSALALAHPALAGRAIETRRFAEAGGAPFEDHGTAIAALLVGREDAGHPGLVPAARLFAADVFGRDPSGRPAAGALDLVRALAWLAEAEAAVVNLSLAGPANDLVADALARMSERGVTLVAAAGNGGAGAPPAHPAALAEVLAVTAVDRQLGPYREANRGSYVSLAAPGVDLRVATPDAGTDTEASGTSFATAYVSAIAAAGLAARVAEDREPLTALLAEGARDLGAPGHDPVFGWGLVQAGDLCRPDPAG